MVVTWCARTIALSGAGSLLRLPAGWTMGRGREAAAGLLNPHLVRAEVRAGPYARTPTTGPGTPTRAASAFRRSRIRRTTVGVRVRRRTAGRAPPRLRTVGAAGMNRALPAVPVTPQAPYRPAAPGAAVTNRGPILAVAPARGGANRTRLRPPTPGPRTPPNPASSRSRWNPGTSHAAGPTAPARAPARGSEKSAKKVRAGAADPTAPAKSSPARRRHPAPGNAARSSRAHHPHPDRGAAPSPARTNPANPRPGSAAHPPPLAKPRRGSAVHPQPLGRWARGGATAGASPRTAASAPAARAGATTALRPVRQAPGSAATGPPPALTSRHQGSMVLTVGGRRSRASGPRPGTPDLGETARAVRPIAVPGSVSLDAASMRSAGWACRRVRTVRGTTVAGSPTPTGSVSWKRLRGIATRKPRYGSATATPASGTAPKPMTMKTTRTIEATVPGPGGAAVPRKAPIAPLRSRATTRPSAAAVDDGVRRRVHAS